MGCVGRGTRPVCRPGLVSVTMLLYVLTVGRHCPSWGIRDPHWKVTLTLTTEYQP